MIGYKVFQSTKPLNLDNLRAVINVRIPQRIEVLGTAFLTDTVELQNLISEKGKVMKWPRDSGYLIHGIHENGNLLPTGAYTYDNLTGTIEFLTVGDFVPPIGSNLIIYLE